MRLLEGFGFLDGVPHESTAAKLKRFPCPFRRLTAKAMGLDEVLDNPPAPHHYPRPLGL